MDNISITDIIALIGVAVMLWQKFFSKEDKRKLSGENEKTVSETGQLALDNTADALSISKQAIEQVKQMKSELDIATKNYKKDMECLRVDIEELQFEAQEKDAMIESLKDWAERLVYQVKSLGGTAVEFKPPKKVSRKN